jgi:hypothetical protein
MAVVKGGFRQSAAEARGNAGDEECLCHDGCL